jgi:hypothetical protein
MTNPTPRPGATDSQTAIEADLRAGLQASERRRRIAAVVADHHQDRLAGYRTGVPVDLVKAGFDAVLTALNGTTDPDRLGLAGDPLFVEQLRSIVTSTSGEDARG